MADIAVSIPHGGGTIKTAGDLTDSNVKHGFAYCWLGGTSTTGPDNNLYIAVRLQKDPDFAVIDLFTQNLRNTSQHGRVVKRSRIYNLGGNAFSSANDFHERMINITRVNSTTALLKIPFLNSKSTYYILEVDESTHDVTSYAFEEESGGLYSFTSSYYAYGQEQLFMQRVEDNVIVTYDQNASSQGYLNQRVWDPSAKTLSTTRIVNGSGNSSGVNITNFMGSRMISQYGDNTSGQNSSHGFARSDSNPTYIYAVEGRDGKWHFRSTQSGNSNFASIYNPSPRCFTYIPTSQGGDLATSGYSQSWGLTGGFNSQGNYGRLTNNQGRYGVFLPIEVVDSQVNNVNNNFPNFYMKSYIEIGGYSMKVHTDGTENTELNYNANYIGSGSWVPKQALWLDSNHFFVHGTSNMNQWTNPRLDRYYVNQYVDESYTESRTYGNWGNYNYNNMTSNGGSQWTKIDDYTLTCQGFNFVHNIWAPE